jgi:hypothetical protein
MGTALSAALKDNKPKDIELQREPPAIEKLVIRLFPKDKGATTLFTSRTLAADLDDMHKQLCLDVPSSDQRDVWLPRVIKRCLGDVNTEDIGNYIRDSAPSAVTFLSYLKDKYGARPDPDIWHFYNDNIKAVLDDKDGHETVEEWNKRFNESYRRAHAGAPVDTPYNAARYVAALPPKVQTKLNRRVETWIEDVSHSITTKDPAYADYFEVKLTDIRPTLALYQKWTI